MILCPGKNLKGTDGKALPFPSSLPPFILYSLFLYFILLPFFPALFLSIFLLELFTGINLFLHTAFYPWGTSRFQPRNPQSLFLFAVSWTLQ